MTRLTSSIALSIALFLAFTCGVVVADDDRMMIEGGKELFQRQWTHEAPPVLEQAEGETQPQFALRLQALPGDGLGPMFNATSCEDCHVRGGGAGVDHNVTLLTIDPRSPVIKTDSVRNFMAGRRNQTAGPDQIKRDALVSLYPGLLSPRGALSMDVVVHEKSARPFYDSIRDQIGQHVPGGAQPSWFVSEKRTVDAIANQPVLAGRVGEIDFYLSQRNSPPLFGLGMIDKIDVSKLQTIARSQDRRSGGKISGRLGAGKFGWRAQTPTLDQFVRGACAGELGLQVARTPQPGDAADETYLSLGIDLQESEVNMLVSYVRSLPYPMQETRLPDEAKSVRDGKRLFAKIGCAACHVENVYPARGLYSDLLLHDMGELLQAPSPAPANTTTMASMPRLQIPVFPPDTLPISSLSFIGGYYGVSSSATPRPYEIGRPDEPKFPRGSVPKHVLETRDLSKLTWDSMQREWRTPPLWGVADSAPYLHDGRAATLDSAIRWHGGEASDATTAYRSLTKEARMEVIAFLASLRSPPGHLRNDDVQPVIKSVVTHVAKDEPASNQSSLAEALDVFQQGY